MTEQDTVDVVRARASQWQAALEARDLDAIGDYLHPGYALVLVIPGPVTVHRDEWLRTLPDYVVHSYDIHQQTIDVIGDVATVMTSATQHATALGVDRSGGFIVSDIWLRGEDGSWRVWRRHSTPATAREMPRLDDSARPAS